MLRMQRVVIDHRPFLYNLWRIYSSSPNVKGMSAPAGTDDQVRRSAISFRQNKGANYTLSAFDVNQKLTAIIPTAIFDNLSDQEVNRLSRLFEETYANPPPAGASRRRRRTRRYTKKRLTRKHK